MESLSRVAFALAVALGITSGQTAVALGIAAAPFVSLVVVPVAFARSSTPPSHALDGPITVDEADAALAGPGTEGVQEAAAHDDLSLRRGGYFAIWVSGIMLAEQALLNAAVLTVNATARDAALAGIVFNILLIARAPLQLFQAIQTSLLPHLTGLEATAGHEAFAHAIRVTVLAIVAFAGAVALGLLLIGPFVMEHILFGQNYSYGRVGLAMIGVGMGLHLISGALNQAALARDKAHAAAGCWILAAVVFVIWMLTPLVSEEVLRTEIGYAGATGLLALALTLLYRRGTAQLQSAAVLEPAWSYGRRSDRADGARQGRVGARRVLRAEDRRARHEQACPGLAAAGRRLRVDAAVDLDRRAIAGELPQAAQLLQGMLDEGLAAPAGVDGHAEDQIGHPRHVAPAPREASPG